MSKTFAKAAKNGFAVAAGAAAGFAAKGSAEFAKFDTQMREVFTLLPDLTKSEMGKMTGDVKGFAKEFGVLPDKVVPALYQAISAGVPKENVFTFLETAQKAAKGGVTDLETAVDGISSVVNAYGADVIDAAKASDLMFTAVKGGKTNFEQLSQSLFNVIPTAASLGVQFGDVTAALATMTAQGTPTSVATTQLRQLFVELSKDSSKLAGTFEGIAGKSFRQFIAEGGNTQQALQLLEKHVGGLAGATSKAFGTIGKELSKSGADHKNWETTVGKALAGTGLEVKDVNKEFKAITHKSIPDFLKSGGDINKVFAQMAKDAAKGDSSLADLFGSVEAGNAALALTGAGTEKFAAELAAAGDSAGATDTAFATMNTGISATADRLKAKIAVFAIDVGEKISAIGPQWLSLGLTMAGQSGPILTAFSTVVGGAARMMAGAGASIATTVAHWVWLGVQSLIHAAKVAAAWALSTGPALVTAVATMVATSAVFVAKWAWMGVQSLLHAAKVALAWVIALGPVGLIVAAVIAAVVLIIANWDKISAAATKVWEWVKEKFGKLVEFVKGLPGKIADAASGMWDGIKGAFKSAVNAIIRIWNGLEFKIPGFKIGPVGFEGFTLGVPDIPELARGGRFNPGLAVTGERGPEIALFDRPGFMVNNTDLEALLSGGGAPIIGGDLVLNAADMTPADVSAELSWWSKTSGR